MAQITRNVQVVWFKRDLRVADHAPLAAAARRGPVLPLYIVEPAYWREPDVSERQWNFVRESLIELDRDLAALGQRLIVRTGDVVEVLKDLHARHGIAHLWSHEETGNAWTFRRDITVGAFVRERSIPWTEERQTGVIRRLRSRDGWAQRWDRQMAEPVAEAPRALAQLTDLVTERLPQARDLRLPPCGIVDRQKGGRAAAEERLASFLTVRGEPYRWAMSTPREGATACSRLSPHLAFGTISLKEVTQATYLRMRQLKAEPQDNARGWRGSMVSFAGRLHWHCHFMQKLEDETSIEFREFHPATHGLRALGSGTDRLTAWANGETGFPFLDACMRSLKATGWLNFRMRAMVQSFASYNLWLHWRDSGLHLARMFTDYEPGIHWSQAQMQSGTTGINTVRIYNVLKQGHDQDKFGHFVRQWVPELRDVPTDYIQEPWRWAEAERILGKTYPAPIIELTSSTREAKDRIFATRRTKDFNAAANAIQTKHGSRKAGLPMTGQRRKKQTKLTSAAGQLKLDL
jgi:deoxyribodipyrimidine photo-lyase